LVENRKPTTQRGQKYKLKYARPTSTYLQCVFGRIVTVFWRAIFESPMAGKLEVASQLIGVGGRDLL